VRVGVLQNSLSDHSPVYGVIHGLSCRPRHRIIISRSWNEDHITAFQADMAKIPWNNLTTPDNIDQKLENWNTFFRNNLDKHFPVRRKRIRQKSHPWLDSSILRLMRIRDYVHKRALRLSDSDTWELYKQLRNQVTSKLGNNAVTSSSTDLMNIGEIQRNFGKHCDSFSQRKINLPVSINWSWKTRKL
jgi:hypothetical protein